VKATNYWGRVTIHRVRSHSHRTCMHLLLTIYVLESPSILTMFKHAPPVCFSKPLPVVLGVNCRSLATEHFHIVADKLVMHGTSRDSRTLLFVRRTLHYKGVVIV
jgi:hypothetical protein